MTSNKIQGVFERYKHLDKLLCDKKLIGDGSLPNQILYDPWQATKETIVNENKVIDILAEIDIGATLINNYKDDPKQMEFYSDALHKYVKKAITILGISEARFIEICDEVM